MLVDCRRPKVLGDGDEPAMLVLVREVGGGSI